MRYIDKRAWVCSKSGCRLSHKETTALCEEVPQNKKCPLCGDPIYILSREKEPKELSFVEIFEKR